MSCRRDEEVFIGHALLPEQRRVDLAALLVLFHRLCGRTGNSRRVRPRASPTLRCHRRRSSLLLRPPFPLLPLTLPGCILRTPLPLVPHGTRLARVQLSPRFSWARRRSSGGGGGGDAGGGLFSSSVFL